MLEIVERSFLGSITINNVDSREWKATVFVSEINKNVEFLVESGADISCIPKNFLNHTLLKNIKASDGIVSRTIWHQSTTV